MTKGDRQRANKAPRENATKKIDKSDVTPLMQNEAYLFKELIDQSNHYAKLLKQYEEFEFAYQNLTYKRKQIQKGEIEISSTAPIYVPMVGNALVPITDKKMVLKDIDTQLNQLKLQRDSVKGQLSLRGDEYVASALRLRSFMDNRFGKYTTTVITAPAAPTGVRVKTGEKAKKDEQKIFEAEFNDILNDAETKAKFKDAVEVAKKHNEALEK